MLINFDHSKIRTVGFNAIGEYLKHLQIYKSTADVENGTNFFKKYSEVDSQMLKLRDIVIQN